MKDHPSYKYFKRVKDKDLKEELLYNLKKYPITKTKHVKDIKDLASALQYGFTWRRTKRDFEYWHKKKRLFRMYPKRYITASPLDKISKNYSI